MLIISSHDYTNTHVQFNKSVSELLLRHVEHFLRSSSNNCICQFDYDQLHTEHEVHLNYHKGEKSSSPVMVNVCLSFED